MFFLNVCLLASAHLLNNTDIVTFLECDGENQWKSNYFTGQIFGTFHVIMIILSTIQAERVFYSMPHKMGYFESNKIKLRDTIMLRDQMKSQGDEQELFRGPSVLA